MMYPNFEKVAELSERSSLYGKSELSEQTIALFAQDLTDLLDVLKRYYAQNFEDMVSEQKPVFEKFEKIAACYPEILDVDVFWYFLHDVLAAGCLPHPIVYCHANLIDEPEMADAAFLYLNDKNVQQWIVDNWHECKKYKALLAEALHKQTFKLPKLVRMCHMHYAKKTMLLLVVIIGCAFLCWNNVAYPLVVVLLLFVFIFMLKEISSYLYASACQKKHWSWR